MFLPLLMQRGHGAETGSRGFADELLFCGRNVHFERVTSGRSVEKLSAARTTRSLKALSAAEPAFAAENGWTAA